MKSYDEIADNVFSRRDEAVKKKIERKKRIVGISSVVSCLAAVTVLGAGIFHGEWLTLGTIGETPVSGDDTVVGRVPDDTDEVAPPVSNVEPLVPDMGNIGISGGEADWFSIPTLPFDRTIAAVGEEITDGEACEYFAENSAWIIDSLAASGVDTENIKISEKGYSHVSYDGVMGKSFEVKLNFRDYLVYNGDELVAMVTLVKQNGEISATPSFGAKWFEGYADYLRAHSGEELVYVYAGCVEIIVAPDDTCYIPLGYDVSWYIGALENPYETFYHEAAIYIP